MVKNYDKHGREIDLKTVTLPVKGFEAVYRMLEDIAQKKDEKTERK